MRKPERLPQLEKVVGGEADAPLDDPELLSRSLQAQGIDVMSSMFEKDEAGFTEAYDPNAEPGTIAEAGAEAGEGEGEVAAEAPADAEAAESDEA